MSNYSIKRIDDMEGMYRGGMKRARAELGVTSFGLQVLDLPPGSGQYYPEHDHSGDGQEEVYVLLRGSGEIEIEGERHPLDPDCLVRVGPGVKRRLWPGSEGMRLLALGGVPGQAYQVRQSTELGQPDPMAG